VHSVVAPKSLKFWQLVTGEVVGGMGGGNTGERGWDVYGKQEKRGREAGFPRQWEVEELGEHYATLDMEIREWGMEGFVPSASSPPSPQFK